MRYLIMGNSGSGKSTYAKHLAILHKLPHLDLDSIAWQANAPTTRRPLSESKALIDQFTDANPHWVIEGCYSSLLQHVVVQADPLIFLNPGIEACQKNCRARPFEPHKYATKQAQDANLPMLLDWVARYAQRDDEFSLQAHRALFDQFNGNKAEFTQNPTLQF